METIRHRAPSGQTRGREYRHRALRSKRVGLLHTSQARLASGYRRYGDSQVARLRFIRRAQELRILARRTSASCSPSPDCGTSRASSAPPSASSTKSETRIAALQRVRDALSELIAQCPGHGRAAACPILNALGAEIIQMTARHAHDHAHDHSSRCVDAPGCCAASPKWPAPGAARRPGHDLHLPDASGDPPGRTRDLSDLRYGAGAAGAAREARTTPKLRAVRQHFWIALALALPVVAGRHVAASVRPGASSCAGASAAWCRAGAHGARGAVGGADYYRRGWHGVCNVRPTCTR